VLAKNPDSEEKNNRGTEKEGKGERGAQRGRREKNSNEYASIIARERKSIFILYKIEYRPLRYTVDSVYRE